MTRKEQLITWGLLGFIAYELWKENQPPAPAVAPFAQNNASPLPGWLQQFSYTEVHDNAYTPQSDIDNLLAVPQGPGGSYQYQTDTVNFFNPISGALSFCQTPTQPSAPGPGGASSGTGPWFPAGGVVAVPAPSSTPWSGSGPSSQIFT